MRKASCARCSAPSSASYVYRIADALADGDGEALLAESDALAARGLASALALEELSSLFHRIAVAQVVPAAAAGFDDAARIAAYARRFTPEMVQLLYQIAAQGRADLALAPDETTGFAMTLLRMLAFVPGTPAAEAPPRAANAQPPRRRLRVLPRRQVHRCRDRRSPP